MIKEGLLYNKNNIPRKDIFAYTQIMGIVIGLIFSSEVFDAMSTLLTPTKSIILSKSAYEEKIINKYWKYYG